VPIEPFPTEDEAGPGQELTGALTRAGHGPAATVILGIAGSAPALGVAADEGDRMPPEAFVRPGAVHRHRVTEAGDVVRQVIRQTGTLPGICSARGALDRSKEGNP
jgi:hypothetical protein